MSGKKFTCVVIVLAACGGSEGPGPRYDIFIPPADVTLGDDGFGEEGFDVNSFEQDWPEAVLIELDESAEQQLEVVEVATDVVDVFETGAADIADADLSQDLPCTISGCPPGFVCMNNTCEACTFNFACGPSCEDCSITSKPLCLGGTCVECRVQSDCQGKGWCKDNACVPCMDDDPDHCGAECAKCEGKTPICVQGSCACTGSSCGSEYCLNGHCDPCESDAACGPSCLPCPNDKPYCVAKKCVECLSDLDCEKGTWCKANTCVPCGDDPLHCGPACIGCPANAPECVDGACRCTPTSCGIGNQCVNGECVGCTTAAACGPSCVKCVPPTPYCFKGDHCVECQPETALTDCPPSWYCGQEGMCVDPCAGTPGCLTDTKSTSGTKCSTAWVLGRKDLAKGLTVNGDTYGRKNDDDLPSKTIFTPDNPDCWDANEDDVYKVWMFAGDVLEVTATPLSTTYDMSLKLYRGTLCAASWKTDLITCEWKAGDSMPEKYTFTAAQNGWVSIVVDGASAFTEQGDYGPYTLKTKLTCSGLKCCCQ